MTAKSGSVNSEAQVMVGLEIHFQLRGQKLFCDCSTENLGIEGGTFERKLSPTVSEMGQFDPAAEYEKARARTFQYVQSDNCCLVEADEEPPHKPNQEAIETGLMVAHALNCSLVDSVMFMRKLVVDGSNTSGFQRTAVLGLAGKIETSKGRVGISTVCIEEDSARKAEVHSKESGVVYYSLDRLGIPLLEIATDPDIVDSEHAVEVAKQIGYIVASTGKSRREVDSIRQDVNISLGFGRVEMKGIQKLSLIADSINHEIERQRRMSNTIGELKKRGGTKGSFQFKNVGSHFEGTGSKMVRAAFQRGEMIFCSVAENMSGLLKNGDHRLGKDLSDIAKAYGLGGILHTDELPAFGIMIQEVESVRSTLSPGKNDALIFIISDRERMPLISKALNERVRKLSALDFSETRGPNDDGTTRYLRPLPGSHRMYPETDVPVFEPTKAMLSRVKTFVPKGKEEVAHELSASYGISLQDANTIASSLETEDFKQYAQALNDGKLAARIMLQTIPEMERKLGRSSVRNSIIDLLKISASKNWQRVVLEAALESMIKNSLGAQEAVKSVKKLFMDTSELREIVASIVEETGKEIKPGSLIAMIKERTEKSFDPKSALELLKRL